MHIYKNGKTWMVETRIGGRKIRKSTGTHDRAKAEAIAAVLFAARRTQADAARQGLHDLLDQIMDACARPRRTPLDAAPMLYKQTIKSIGRDSITESTLNLRINHYIAFAEWAKTYNHEAIEDITGPVAATYAEHLAALGKKSKTRKNTIGDLSTIWRILAKRISRLDDPWRDLTPKITDANIILPFTMDEEERILQAAKETHEGLWYLPALVARHTGLREGDVAALSWDDVDLAHGIISTTPEKTKRHGIKVSIPIAAVLAPQLHALAAGKLPKTYGQEYGNGYLVFPALSIMKARKSRQRKPFADVLTAAGVDTKTHTFHSWRHTAATRMGAAGVDIETRKLILGHTTDAMAEHYDHDPHLDAKRAAVDAAAFTQRQDAPPPGRSLHKD